MSEIDNVLDMSISVSFYEIGNAGGRVSEKIIDYCRVRIRTYLQQNAK
jgi:hypothetical protein